VGNGSRFASAVVFLTLLAGVACSGLTPQQPESEELRRELDRLRFANAVLRTRLAVAADDEPYVVLDLPERELRLEFRGLVLSRSVIAKVKLNRRARRISGDTTRIGFCRLPFHLRQEGWYEDVPTLALKDSTVVMSQPDTTGLLAEQIHRARILGLLRFDRDLAVALTGRSPPASVAGHVKTWLLNALRPLWPGSGVWQLRTARREAILLELMMDPVLVRSLAPSLKDGTRLVLEF
jgi:hypothetical protein